MRTIKLIALAALLQLCCWWLLAHPVTPSAQWRGPLASASFAPYRDGQSPLTRDYPSEEQIRRDLASLKGLFNGVRTYTSLEGMQVVPEAAQALGMRVLHSAWLGVDRNINRAEEQALIAAANRYPEVIDRVIVGNEVLLRRDLPVDELIGHIDRVRAAVKQPVSYADVWAFWLKYPQVAEHVDFITIHILPYWEDEPASIQQVETHLVDILKRMHAAFPGKPILIGEAGWPSQGRSRGPANADLPTAAQFVRLLPQLSDKYGFDYNLVEAFDQTWKSALEGTVGARWGLFDAERQQKFPLTGAVTPLPDWGLRVQVALLLGLLAPLLVWSELAALSRGRVVSFALLSNGLALLFTQASFDVFTTSFTASAYLWACISASALGLFLACVLARAWSVLSNTAIHWVSRLGQPLTLLLVLAAVWETVLLSFAGRYRDIPVAEFAPLAFGLFALGAVQLAQGRSLIDGLRWSALFGQTCSTCCPYLARLLAYALLVCIPLALWGEGWAVVGEDFSAVHPTFSEQLPLIIKAAFSNRQMMEWVGLLLVMALPFWLERRPKA